MAKTKRARSKPPLLAILICENVIYDRDNAAILYRLIDTFNVEVAFPRAEPQALAQLKVLLKTFVFTRWGPGAGSFTEELAIVRPSGIEFKQRAKFEYEKPGGFHFQQNVYEVAFHVSDSGTYKFRVYLNGKVIGEHPFQVNIERIIPTESGG